MIIQTLTNRSDSESEEKTEFVKVNSSIIHSLEGYHVESYRAFVTTEGHIGLIYISELDRVSELELVTVDYYTKLRYKISIHLFNNTNLSQLNDPVLLYEA